ncbi:hypothetical protein [Thaumasiovibrio subtropicus]|uniref:hypothetical protein n=1 Tax=Thaumasiovibrio subtropicus TaxID=1891207 RepID=UPI000B350144|nr:hypothetical protein [Thaumasiovibrio subtropicus]
MKSRQRGMMSLMITGMLLIGALLFSLGSAKTVFYQVKRAQNEIEARKAHWGAEGGLECVFATANSSNKPPSDATLISDCNSLSSDLSINVTVGLDDYTVDSKVAGIRNESTNQRKIVTGSRVMKGAIQTAADLVFNGDVDIFPDVSGPHPAGDYKCLAVVYKSQVSYNPSVTTNRFTVENPKTDGPYEDFSGSCHSDYKTTLTTASDTTSTPPGSSGSEFKNDFLKDPNLDPFESFFKASKADIADVRSGYEVRSSTPSSNCKEIIEEAFSESSDNKVWIQGHCDIGGTGIMTGDHTPKTLVIENGLFGSWGVSEFHGAIYHLVDVTKPPFNDASSLASTWEIMKSHAQYKDYLALSSGTTVYMDGGAFYPEGGAVFDSPGGQVVIHGSYSLSYNSEKNGEEGQRAYDWVKGSWNDF